MLFIFRLLISFSPTAKLNLSVEFSHQIANMSQIFYRVVFHSRISITTRGKYAAIEAGTISHLVALLHDESSEVRLNALKVCFNLSSKILSTP